MEKCVDADEVMRLYHNLGSGGGGRRVDVGACMRRAHALRSLYLSKGLGLMR